MTKKYSYENREAMTEGLFQSLLNEMNLDYDLTFETPVEPDQLIITGNIFADSEDINPPASAVEIDQHITAYFNGHTNTKQLIDVDVEPVKEVANEHYEFVVRVELFAKTPFDTEEV